MAIAAADAWQFVHRHGRPRQGQAKARPHRRL